VRRVFVHSISLNFRRIYISPVHFHLILINGGRGGDAPVDYGWLGEARGGEGRRGAARRWRIQGTTDKHYAYLWVLPRWMDPSGVLACTRIVFSSGASTTLAELQLKIVNWLALNKGILNVDKSGNFILVTSITCVLILPR
jgi:hypothetical protein